VTKGTRQGDVLIVPTKSIPSAATKISAKNGRVIVAEGEATGHHHSFPHQRGAVLFRDDGAGGGMYIRATKSPRLEHQEHHEIYAAADFCLSDGTSFRAGDHIPTRTDRDREIVSLAIRENAPLDRRGTIIENKTNKVIIQRTFSVGSVRRVVD